MTKLKVERLKQKISQQELAQRSGVKAYRISMAENGELKLKANELEKLAETLNVNGSTLEQPV